MSSHRRNATLAALAAMAMSLAACGSLPRTSPTQPPTPSASAS